MITIFIQTLAFRKRMEIDTSDSIKYLREKISDNYNVFPEQVKLYFFHKKLDDDKKTIGEYGIIDKSLIYVVFNLQADLPYNPTYK